MITIESFPNIKRYREAKGFTIQQMATKTRMPVEYYKKIESGKSDITNEDLYVIAKALKVEVPKLIYPTQELRNVRFRSNKQLKDRQLVILDVEYWLNEYKFIEDLLGDQLPSPIVDLGIQIKKENKNIVEAANLTRKRFGLDADEPIFNLGNLLEINGVKVGNHVIKSHDFMGLSANAREGGPAIVINTWNKIPVECWIFTAAHELAHLVLHQSDFKVSQTKEGKMHENEANNFASEFLMPDVSFIKLWYEINGLSLVDRIITMKRIFRVSYKTVLQRLVKHFPENENILVQFQSDYLSIYGKSLILRDGPKELAKNSFLRSSFLEQSVEIEPEPLTPADFRFGRFESLVRKALEEKKISLGRGAEILQISRQELRELAKSWHC